MRPILAIGIALVVALLAVGVWLAWVVSAAHSGTPGNGDFTPREHVALTLSGPRAADERLDLIRRATFRVDPASSGDIEADRHSLDASPVICRYVARPPSGTSAKFTCILEGGELVKVKYGRNAEIQSETAATRLLSLLGYAADRVTIVPHLRCYGCPRFPFLTMQLLSWANAASAIGPAGHDNGYTDFEDVSVERKFPATEVGTATTQGWTWYELQESKAPRVEVDAFRLLAVFLAHWDNKSENQRLVCLDPPNKGMQTCDRPLMMIHDLGATFGPLKANLAWWRAAPLWRDRRTCLTSMESLPFHGGTFREVHVSEAGRASLVRQLSLLSDHEIREIFDDAQFPEFYSGTDDRRDLDAWTEAFRYRVDQLRAAGPCD